MSANAPVPPSIPADPLGARGSDDWKLHGYVAEYGDVDQLIHACEKVRDAGYTRWDAHSPFPVHGIDDAMGVKPTILPWIVLGGGLTGLASAILLQWWTNAVDYPFIISGKPLFSIPANVPIMFELTVLLSAISAFLAVLLLNVLPQLHHPLFNVERFKRATDDRFFISIDAADPLFHEVNTRSLLAGTGAAVVESALDLKRHPPLPRAFLFVGVVATVFTFVPLALIYKARFAKSNEPRIHLVWDMDWQPKYKTQKAAGFSGFGDGRTMRLPVAGTQEWNEAVDPTPFTTGKDAAGAWITDLPVQVDALLMDRGQERFGIFCAPCHGLDGRGQGMIAVRAQELGQGGFVPPTNLLDQPIRDKASGELFNTITHGIRTMPPYGAQVEVEDRWAIVLYLRALQRSQYATIEDVPQDQRGRFSGPR